MSKQRPIRVLQLTPMMPSVSNPEAQMARLREHFGDDVQVVGSHAIPDEYWSLVDLVNSHRADVLDAELPTRLAELIPRAEIIWIRPQFRTVGDFNSAYRGEFVRYQHMIVRMVLVPFHGQGTFRRRRFPRQRATVPKPPRPVKPDDYSKHDRASVG